MRSQGRRSNIASRAGFLQHVGVLAGGTAFGQVLTVAITPVLTRMYAPSAFGSLGVYAAILTTITAISALKYELAIPVCENDDAADRLLILCVGAVMGSALLTWLAVWLAGPWLSAPSSALEVSIFRWLLPIGVIGAGTYRAATYWAFRHSKFTAVARTRVYQRIGQSAIQVGAGLVTNGSFGLVLGHLFGQSGGSLSLLRAAWRNRKSSIKAVTVNSIRSVAARYRRFPLFSSWASVLNTASVRTPNIILAASFGAATAGLYALSYQALQLPMRFVGDAIGQVFFSSAARARQDEGVAGITMEVFSSLVGIGLPTMLILMFALPDVFGIVFGPEWRQAGVFSVWLAPWLCLVFIASPLSTLASVLERQRIELLFQLVLATVRIVGLGIGVVVKNATVAVSLFGVLSAGCWLWYLFWALHISGNSRRVGARIMMREVGATIPYLLPVATVGYLVEEPLALLAITVIVSSVFGWRLVYRWRKVLST